MPATSTASSASPTRPPGRCTRPVTRSRSRRSTAPRSVTAESLLSGCEAEPRNVLPANDQEGNDMYRLRWLAATVAALAAARDRVYRQRRAAAHREGLVRGPRDQVLAAVAVQRESQWRRLGLLRTWA